MAQQPYTGRGRGGGRGHMQQQQQRPQQQPYAGYPAVATAPRPMGAWQPAAPTSMAIPQQQQPPPYSPQQQPPTTPGVVPVTGQSQVSPVPTGGVARGMPMQQQQQYAPPNQGYNYNPYHPNYGPYIAAQQQGGRGPAQQQQQVYYNPNMPQGHVYFPPQQQFAGANPMAVPAAVPLAATAPTYKPPPPREKKPSLITDKDGNVLDFTKKETKATPAPATTATATPATTAAATSVASAASSTAAAATTAPPPVSDAGAKMLQLAQERLGVAKPTETVEEKLSASEPAKTSAPEPKVEVTKPPSDAPVKSLADRMAAVKLDDAPAATKAAEPMEDSSNRRKIYTKEQLLSFKSQFTERPDSLPDLTIVKIPVSAGQRGGGGGGGGKGGGRQDRGGGDGSQKGGDWSRGSAPPRRESANVNQSNGREPNQWSRGHAPPPQQEQQQNNRQGGRGGKHQNDGPIFDGPVAPLVKSENHWRPKKSTSAFDIAEKQVMSVLNKMTKEKFAKLSEVMVSIPITSSEILTLMIDRVYDKAIDEPAFGEIYADLCFKLSHSAQISTFVHIIESDEEPPTEGDATSDRGDSTSNTVYRWSNDVSTSDAELVGPFDSVDACWDAALSEEEATPVPRGDMELKIEKVAIRRGMFVKIMKKKDSEEDVFYTVYFPVHEAVECGQQMSEIFLSEVECISDSKKKNKFKRSLLNKCEEEFTKQDIYADWIKEKEAFEQQKDSMTEAERAEKETDLNFRRIRIKKQMLGNVKFIGQLYKKKLVREKVMRFCISSLLKLDETKVDPVTGEMNYKDSGNVDIDEEDHEALCSIFTTVGSTIDTPAASEFVNLCFTKIKALSTSKELSSRSRFMYKDLLDLRSNRWVPRRKEEKAKTLEEIRKDVEREERLHAQQSAQAAGRGGFGGGRGGGGGRGDRDRRPVLSIRPRPKVVTETDDDGFVTAVNPRNAPKVQPRSIQTRPNGAAAIPTRSSFAALAANDESGPDSASTPTAAAGPEPLSSDQVERRIKSMPIDFMNDSENVDELLLSFDEISGTPDAGQKLVSKSMDRLVDCKQDERLAIMKVLVLLYENKKLTASDVQDGLSDTIEFIDSIVTDAPRAFEYVGSVLSDMIRIGAIDLIWVASQLEKCKEADPDTQAPERTVKATLGSFKTKEGLDAAKALAEGAAPALASLMGESALDGIMQTL